MRCSPTVPILALALAVGIGSALAGPAGAARPEIVSALMLPDASRLASVSGRVVDEAGLPIPGVNIVVEGTTRGAASDLDGRYRIDALPAGPVKLVASAIGFRSVSRALELGETDVVADFVLEEDVLFSGEVVVTASRREQTALEAPASVAILSTRDLEARNTVAIDDALRYIPGVHVQENQVNIRGSSGFAYNTGSRVLLLIDGMPLLTPDSDGMPFDALPVAQIERIEVVKGPGSSLYGGGALGGVVNIITKDVGEESRTRISGFAGAHGPARYDVWQAGYPKAAEFRPFGGFTASHARRVSDQLSGWINLSLRRDQGYLNYNRASYAQGFLKLNWTPRPSIRGELLSGLLVREKDNFLFWNGARDALNPGTLAIGAQDSGVPTGTNDISSNQITLLPSVTHLVNDKLFYAVRGRVFASMLRPLDDDGNPLPWDNGTVGARYGGEFELDWAPSQQRNLTLGVSGDAMATRSTFFVTADGDSTGGQPETAAFVQWEESVAGFSMAGGLRLDRYAIDTGTTITRLSPKLAVSKALGDGTAVRAAYGQGFRVPSLAERFTDNQDFFPIVRNLELLPERSVSVEVGVRDARRLRSRLYVETDIALFLSHYTDLIEPKLVPELRAFQFINLTEARIVGGEASIEIRNDRGAFRLGYTLLDAEDRILGQPLASRSRHQLTTGFDWQLLSWLDLGADWRGMSAPERVDSDFALFVPDADLLVPMRVLDLRATFSSGPLRASLLLNNAFDYYYLERPAFLAPPRHVQLRVQLEF